MNGDNPHTIAPDLGQHLKQKGEIAVIPTDTVYGVVARVADSQAVARLYRLKHREGKPGTVVAASIDQLVAIGIKYEYLKKVEQLWPGAVSVIIPCDQNLFYVHQGADSLAIRIPDNAGLLELLKETGPLLTSSANQPGEPPATTVSEARAYFGDQVDWYEDGGIVQREPSTVVKIVDDAIEIVRQGAISFDGSLVSDAPESTKTVR
ncbi:MAG TPA: L-threonylcarbamoyladenylate synthase [Candidatus Microsaccharimonas sp.]|jgi:tRNA threonylcarbamoyl adenosine modification protein (Sua5/YciO/YrdC/YwlC family)